MSTPKPPSLTFAKLMHHLNNKHVYMILGNGSKNQFGDMRKVRPLLKRLVNTIDPKSSAFLYFGDPANKKSPDVGYLFELLHEFAPEIPIYMIQIEEAKDWGTPDFVSGVFWHDDYDPNDTNLKWGGVDPSTEKPVSNTKIWARVNRALPDDLEEVWIFGGGEIAMKEVCLLNAYKIHYKYFPVERKYLGDGKTRVPKEADLKTKIGITYKMKPSNV